MIDDERVSLHVPEQVEVSYELAGLGSRFLAAMIDAIIVTVGIALLAFTAWALRGYLTGNATVSQATGWVVLGASTLLGIAYHVYYEAAREGKSPGKAMTGLRVISVDGGSIGVEQSAVRNIMRIVDSLPFLYAAGVVSLLATAKNQRLGDLAAGAMVVKERLDVREEVPQQPATIQHAPLPPEVSEDVLSVVRSSVRTVSREEEKTIRRFLERRYDLAPDARRRLATRLADALRQRFPGLDPGRLPNPEAFLEVVIRALDERQ